MVPISEVLKKEHFDKIEFLQNELKSLGIELRRSNDLNDKLELQTFAEMIKQVYYQDYKRAYSDINNKNNNENCSASRIAEFLIRMTRDVEEAPFAFKQDISR
jgi:hypothetical protein